MDNQGASINFDDGNHLFMGEEEDSEHEDDKQQDNELKQLMAQGIFDLEESGSEEGSSSSDDSSCDDEENSNGAIQHHQPHNDLNNSGNNLNSNNNNNNLSPVSSNLQIQSRLQMPPPPQPLPPINPLATPYPTNNNNNYLMNEFRNQFSTPANNQIPQPQILQATAIPNVDENAYFRQRTVAAAAAVINEMTPLASDNHNFQRHQIVQQQQQIDNDQTVAHMNNEISYQQNIMQQHYKMHNAERFAVPQPSQPNQVQTSSGSSNNSSASSSASNTLAIIPPQYQPQQSQQQQQHADLSLNMSDNEDSQQLTPMQKRSPPKINNKEQQQQKSMIDLNELNQEQMEQLRQEEEKQQQEYFNINNINREYIQLQFLYKTRGKKLEELQDNFTCFKDDTHRQMRAMNHKLAMCENEKQGLETKLTNALELCQQYKSETDEFKKSNNDLLTKIDEMKLEQNKLLDKLNEAQEEIEHLQSQIQEREKLDSLERLQQQHQHFIEQIKDKHDKEIYHLNENFAQLKHELNEKDRIILVLHTQLDEATKNAEQASIERTEVSNRLTSRLNELQKKYEQDVLMMTSQNKIIIELEQKNHLIEQLNQKVAQFEEQIKLKPTSSTDNENLSTLKKELERLLNENKLKKLEIQKLQSELDQLKNNSDQNNMINELMQEKLDLENDIREKNEKLNELIEKEDEFQRLKNDMELEIYNKSKHIQECEAIIQQLQNDDQSSLIAQQQQEQYQANLNEYEKQITELRFKLSNKESEVQKTIQMYRDLCTDKNNLQDTLKIQYDEEYEKKLKLQLDLAICNKLDEQANQMKEQFAMERSSLVGQFREQIDLKINELKSIEEKLTNIERKNEQLQFEKSNLELKINQLETEMKEKCLNYDKKIWENTEKHQRESLEKEKEIARLKAELDLTKNHLNNQNSKLEHDISDLNKTYENEKVGLLSRIEELSKEKESFALKEMELNEKMRNSNGEFETKIKELIGIIKNKESDIENFDSKSKEYELKIQNLTTQYNIDLDNMKKELIQLKEAKNNIIQEKQKLNLDVEKYKALNDQLNNKLVESEQSKQNLLAKKDEEMQNMITDLEKRFEGDYSEFIDRQKKIMDKVLKEKSEEFAKEKDDLIQNYQTQFSEYEESEKLLQRQIKELKDRIYSESNKLQKDEQTQTTEKEKETNQKLFLPSNNESSLVPYTDDDSHKEYINELLNKIASLEEVISSTDAHFESELEKLRQEIEQDYEMKLENSEMERQKLEDELEKLRYQLNNQETTNSSMSLLDNNDETTTSNSKYSRLRKELNIKEKEMETVEQAYRIKMDQIKDKFDEHLRQLKSKYDNDLERQKQELSEKYKQALSKSKNEIEQMQLFVQKLKKANSDSDKVIESLKQEMAKIKESHLAELTSMKLNSEREKESLKECLEKSIKKCHLLERQLDECEESYKKQCDLLRAELKHEYGSELTKMNNKMKDMQRSHSTAVEILKKQHHQSRLQLQKPISTNDCLVQTETTSRDIELCESFRQKYLDTLSRMKSDLMKEFDAQTLRVSERVTRQINEERKSLNEKVHAIFMPKIIDLLRDYHISETVIRIKIEEIERELNRITSPKKTLTNIANSVSSISISTNSNSQATSSSSSISLGSPSSNSNNLIKFNEKNNLKSTSTENVLTANSNINNNMNNNLTSAKRSASALISNHRSNNLLFNNVLKNMDENSINQHSRSTSNLAREPSKKENSIDLSQNNIENSASKKLSNNNNLSSGYKYTPLRQSWSNLSQMNQFSPYSTVSSSANSEHSSNHSTNQNNLINKHILFEEDNLNNYDHEEDIDEINSNLSPRYFMNQKNYHTNRPLTADSILSRKSLNINNDGLLKKSTHKNQEEELNEVNHFNLLGNDSKEKLHEEEDTLNSDNQQKINDLYFEDDKNNQRNVGFDEDELLSEKTNFYTKYRIQNIRHKKKPSITSSNSVSNLLKETTTTATTTMTAAGSCSSSRDPINKLYELSKNYKTVQIGSVDNNKSKYSNLIRSNTNIESVSRFIQNNNDDNFENENDDQLPIRLSSGSNSNKPSKPTMRSASTVNPINASYSSLSSARSSLSSVSHNKDQIRPNSGGSTKQQHQQTNTLPRSRTPQLNIDTSTNPPSTNSSYRSIANKKLATNGSNENILLSSASSTTSSATTNSLHIHDNKSNVNNKYLPTKNSSSNLHSISSTSTQYHSINSSIGANLIKNGTNNVIHKKKQQPVAFY